ncbi:hypothetical protein COOONC_17724 [Cooperia oncophora]
MLMTLSLAGCRASPIISCNTGTVDIRPPSPPFQLCFNDRCKTFNHSAAVMRYELVPFPHTLNYRIMLRSESVLVQRICDAAPFCDNAAKILSKSLIGNPYCWPVGAIISATFRPAAFTPAASSLALLVALFAALTSPCQDGYMRHSVDLICSQQNFCHYEYKQEILFNSVQSSLCVLLRQRNSTVGYVKVTRTAETLFCQKISHFWTRDTTNAVQQVTRCRGMGSCYGDKCETVAPTEIIPELNSTIVHPGYTACSLQCSGVNCICAIPFRACSFYRVSHIPVSPLVYEIFECSAWVPRITLDIEIDLFSVRKKGQLSLAPYATKEFANFKFTVISLQTPEQGLHQKYVQASNETLAVPANFLFPIACATQQQARFNFSTCNNLHYCDCDVSGIKPSCRCPHNTIEQLRRNSENVLPISAPQIEILRGENTVFARTNNSEVTIAIASKNHLQRAQYHVDIPCSVHMQKLNGCYSCSHGSSVMVSCFASMKSWTTISCANSIFSVECTPENKTTMIRMTFDSAVVKTKCESICGNRTISVELNGILHYVSYQGPVDIFLTNSSTKIPQLDWFDDAHLPDLYPLWLVLITHWKITLVMTIILAIVVLLTYIFGPIVLITLAKLLASATVFSIKTAWVILKNTASGLLSCVRSIKSLRRMYQ